MLKDILTNLIECFRPRIPKLPSKWGQETIVLGGAQDTIKGPLSFEETPWIPYILNRAMDERVLDVVLQFSAQTSKTLTVRTLAAYLASEYPSAMVIAFPNEKLAKSWSQERWQTLFDHSPDLAKLKPSSKHDFNNLSQKLNNGATVDFLGGGSMANLSSRSARFLFVDEVSTFRDIKEYDPITALKERVKAFTKSGAKRVWSSTPNTEDGAITQLHDAGSCTKLFVKSPFAPDQPGFILHTKLFKSKGKNPDGSYDWDKVRRTCYLECPYTGNEIKEVFKPQLIANGEYVDTNPEADPSIFSIHLSEWYSPFIEWGSVLVKFLKARESMGQLRDFTNNSEGLPFNTQQFTDVSKSLKENNVLGDYYRGDEVTGVIPIMTVDCQLTSYKWIVRRYEGRMSYLVDWGEVFSIQEVDAIAEKYRPRIVGLDTGQGTRTAELYRIVAARRHLNWVAIKGEDKLTLDVPFSHSKVDPHTGTTKQGKGPKIDLVIANGRVLKPEIDYYRSGLSPNWQVPLDVTPDYEKELFAEVLIKKRDKTGKSVAKWTKIGVNDYFDAEVYNLCLANYLKISEIEEYSPPDYSRKPNEEKVIEEVKVTEKPKEPAIWSSEYLKSKALKF